MVDLLDGRAFDINVNDNNPNGFCLIHVDLDAGGKPVDWTFIYANEALAKLEGETVEEMVGHRFFELFPNGDRKWLHPYYEAAYEGKSGCFDDISDEVHRYLHIDVYPTGNAGYCICVLYDIRERTKRRETLEKLIDELEKERKINLQVRSFATAMGMVYPLAIAIDYTNDRYQMIEYDNFLNKTSPESGTVEVLVSVGASTIPDPQIAEKFYNLFNREAAIRAFRSGKKDISLRHPQNGDDGKVHYMDTKIICTSLEENRIEGIALSTCVDEEVEHDFAVQEAAQHTEVINALSTIYTAIMEADLTNHYYRNIKSVATMDMVMNNLKVGNFDDVMEDVLTYFVHPAYRNQMRKFLNLGTLADRLATEGTVITEYKNPAGKWFESRFIVQKRDTNGRAISALYAARNVTWEKEIELHYREQLKAAAQEAERANISKTNFLRRMSHDIRTPMNGIVGMLHIMQKHSGDKQKYEECMEKILHSTDYLLNLVNNVLDISKLESGGIMLEHKPFDLGQLLLNALAVVETNANENGVTFLGGQADSHIVHRYVVGSPVHLNRVLMNIASNAVKYNRPGGSLKIYCNELGNDEDSATYEFVCEDTGLGMSETFQQHAFEPFTQEGKETTTSFTGSGLGLSIVKDIVEQMGGRIDLKSKENVGTTFRITLTLPLDKGKHSDEAMTDAMDIVDVTGCRALLVEDNELNMEIAKILLEEMGLVITEAKNGQIAVETFSKAQPYTFDFIFMDMMMPVMDGLEATKTIRALDRSDAKSIPIIAMTANAFVEDKKACLDAGMNDHISKPIDPTAVMQALKRFVK